MPDTLPPSGDERPWAGGMRKLFGAEDAKVVMRLRGLEPEGTFFFAPAGKPAEGDFWFTLAIAAMVVAVLVHVVSQNIVELSGVIVANVPSRFERRALGFCVLVASAIALFVLRGWNIRAYAAIEIGFAIGAAWVGTDLTDPGDARAWTTLGAAVYLFVRGMDNWSKKPAVVVDTDTAGASSR